MRTNESRTRRPPPARQPPRPAVRPRRASPPVASGGRTLAAGRALLVTLLAFAIWLALDARQLYNAAHASPLGVRRSVALGLPHSNT